MTLESGEFAAAGADRPLAVALCYGESAPTALSATAPAGVVGGGAIERAPAVVERLGGGAAGGIPDGEGGLVVADGSDCGAGRCGVEAEGSVVAAVSRLGVPAREVLEEHVEAVARLWDVLREAEAGSLYDGHSGSMAAVQGHSDGFGVAHSNDVSY